ncbi:hypothetical protein, partial [Ralstonia pseudosolanacearum]|uniref:hypothetical protein n=1 Tax=Ralstonia pseudosolanacearum TaxID=1310165 RepID=UPI003CEC69E1
MAAQARVGGELIVGVLLPSGALAAHPDLAGVALERMAGLAADAGAVRSFVASPAGAGARSQTTAAGAIDTPVTPCRCSARSTKP